MYGCDETVTTVKEARWDSLIKEFETEEIMKYLAAQSLTKLSEVRKLGRYFGPDDLQCFIHVL